MSEFCNMSRGKMCYVILAMSIVFFLSSVCTYAVLAVTKDDNVTLSSTTKNNDVRRPQIEQRKIIKRLKRLEERVQKRKKNARRK